MVATIHYRWDFIGLSTQEKPTPETSDKVVDGSTFYSSDDSKLYVWYKDQWYERKALGEGGGGGSTINVVQTTGTSTTDVMSQKAVTDALAGAGGGPTVVQTTGTSTTDVMSQDATTKLIHPDISKRGLTVVGNALDYSQSDLYYAIAIGAASNASAPGSIAIGTAGNQYNSARAAGNFSIAIGAGSYASRKGEMNIGATSSNGYNNTNYRLLSGVHDPVDYHDAATKGYIDTLLAALEARVAALEGN